MSKNVEVIITCLNYDDYLAITLPKNLEQIKNITIVTSSEDKNTQRICDIEGARIIHSKRITSPTEPFAKGKAINDAIDIIGPKEWIMLIDADILLSKNMIENINNKELDQNILYYARRWGPESEGLIKTFMKDFNNTMDTSHLFYYHAFRGISKEKNALDYLPLGYFQLFNVNAFSLLNRKKIYPENGKTAEKDDTVFGMYIFPSDKTAPLPIFDFDVIHLPHGKFMQNWKGRTSPKLEDINV